MALATTVNAQVVDREDLESWNDFLLTIPINKKIDIVVQPTLRFGQNITV
ncbi:MAG: hypothetical protein IPK98_12460 [Chloracidobacterium sp.]|nr:hypothetical protein [Chloracidobacterium sp.]